jgi:hypothetical protein
MVKVMKMEPKYLLFVYEPYEKYHKVMNQPFFADSIEMAISHIRLVSRYKRLFYIDVLRVSDSLHIAKIDNQIPESRLMGLFEEFKKAGD